MQKSNLKSNFKKKFFLKTTLNKLNIELKLKNVKPLENKLNFKSHSITKF